jgi:hypothetical protein
LAQTVSIGGDLRLICGRFLRIMPFGHMRPFPIAAAAFAVFTLLAACVPQHGNDPGADHPNLVVVREFAFSPGVVTLDPSLGFSLNRGELGVAPERRAESVARAAAFSLADAIAQELGRLGYDVVHLEAGVAPPGGRALVVSGTIRSIYEGHRHENASVDAESEVAYQPPSGPAQQLTSFDLDSRRLPIDTSVPPAGRRGADVNYQATRVGAAVGRYVADLARVNRWPAAGR